MLNVLTSNSWVKIHQTVIFAIYVFLGLQEDGFTEEDRRIR